jgi:hypothetical protein
MPKESDGRADRLKAKTSISDGLEKLAGKQ